MENAAFADNLRGVDLGVEWCRVLLSKPLDAFGSNSMSRGHSNHIPVEDEDRATQSCTDADPASSDRLEYRLHGGRLVRGPAQSPAAPPLLLGAPRLAL